MLLLAIGWAYGKDDNGDAVVSLKKQRQRNENTKKIEEAIRTVGEQEQDVKTVNREYAFHMAVLSIFETLKWMSKKEGN